jgi:hypothetical protein
LRLRSGSRDVAQRDLVQVVVREQHACRIQHPSPLEYARACGGLRYSSAIGSRRSRRVDSRSDAQIILNGSSFVSRLTGAGHRRWAVAPRSSGERFAGSTIGTPVKGVGIWEIYRVDCGWPISRCIRSEPGALLLADHAVALRGLAISATAGSPITTISCCS